MDDNLTLINLDADLWFGFPGSELSHQQKIKAIEFDQHLTPWLIDNVGEFGTVWWAELDGDADSMRAVFRDPEMETWVIMTWCDNAD